MVLILKIVEKKLSEDKAHKIKAVFVVHCETSTGVVSNVKKIRDVIDSLKHPALLLVDTISSLGSIDYRHEEWKVDVTVTGSQKGLLLPPGLSFNAVSHKALEAYKKSTLPKSYWDWGPLLDNNKVGFFSIYARYKYDVRIRGGIKYVNGRRIRKCI